MAKKFTDADFVARIRRGHRQWERDRVGGKPAGVRFTADYIFTHGLCSPIYRVLRDGSIARILAQCPEAVRSDWSYRGRKAWTRERVVQTLWRLYQSWVADLDGCRSRGVRWSRTYIRQFPEGWGMLRSADRGLVRIEAVLRQMGGPIFEDWHRYRYEWDPELARERVRIAHRRWQRDTARGKPAGKRFNYHYLAKCCGLEIVSIVRDHYPGGIHRFIKTVPEAARDWQCRRHLSHGETRAEVLTLYRQWLRDPRGRAVCMPFGTAYFRLHRKESYIQYCRRFGIARVLWGKQFATIRRIFGKLPPGFRSRIMCERRQALLWQARAA